MRDAYQFPSACHIPAYFAFQFAGGTSPMSANILRTQSPMSVPS